MVFTLRIVKKGEGYLPPPITPVGVANYGVVTLAVLDQPDWFVSLKASTR